MPTGALRILVTEARGASLGIARQESARFIASVEQCIATAQRADPLGYSRTPLAMVVVHLAHDGAATTVDIDPSDLAHGLSQCLANVLLQWRHAGHTAPRATLRVLVALNVQPLSHAALAR
jgi:hypothetical protein